MFAGLGTSTSRVTLFIDGIWNSYLGGWPHFHFYLHLGNMNLTELPAGVFDGLEHLWRLDLRGNKLRKLPEGLFRNLSGLNNLYLQNNGLEELPSSVWARNHVDKVVCWFDLQRTASLLSLFNL